jgi:hypothetical protein
MRPWAARWAGDWARWWATWSVAELVPLSAVASAVRRAQPYQPTKSATLRPRGRIRGVGTGAIRSGTATIMMTTDHERTWLADRVFGGFAFGRLERVECPGESWIDVLGAQ